MYDWANSAFVTIASTTISYYFIRVVVGDETFYGIEGGLLWPLVLAICAFISFLFAPILGAIADFSNAKKKFLMSFCYTGSTFGLLLFFCGSGDVWKTIIFFGIAQICYVSANVFYDAFLPHIASEDKLDRVSAKGFAYGYLGGGLQLAISMGVINYWESLGIPSVEYAQRVVITLASLWWGGFSLFTLFKLKETDVREEQPQSHKQKPSWLGYIKIGVHRTVETTKKIKRFKQLFIFLISFLIYNDGIQTVILMATPFALLELGIGLEFIMITFLTIQFVAIFGALLFGKLAETISTKKALMISLVMWSVIVTYAYFITTKTQFFILGVLIGLILGGSQSLSRSLFGAMIPVKASAEFYGFYSVFSKFSSIWGLVVFFIVGSFSDNLRIPIISLMIFFVAGLILLSFVNVEEAKKARETELFS